MAQKNMSRLLSQREIYQGVKRLAKEISNTYNDEQPLLLGVLKGSFIFLADLVRALDIPVSIDFTQAKSYDSIESNGNVELLFRPTTPLSGRHVLLVDDIVDTGYTMDYLLSQFGHENPASLKVCSLLDKPSRRIVPVEIDYLGFTVPDKFVVGYGFDYEQRFRNLPDIYVLETA